MKRKLEQNPEKTRAPVPLFATPLPPVRRMPNPLSEFMRSHPIPQRTDYRIPPNQITIPTDEYNPAKPIGEQQRAKLQQIISQLQLIRAPHPRPTHKVGYRFYDPQQRGLQSLAEQNQQQDLPLEMSKQFLSGHAGSNKKIIEAGGRTYYSPFVSLTQSLPQFINTSLGPRGDVNIRHDILHRAPRLGVFSVPETFLTLPQIQNPDQDLPQQEREVLFDSSLGGGLSRFKSSEYSNPFRGAINIDLRKLLMSRDLSNNEVLSNRVRELEKLQKQPQNYGQYLQNRDRLQEEILGYQPEQATSSSSSLNAAIIPSSSSSSSSSSSNKSPAQFQPRSRSNKRSNKYDPGVPNSNYEPWAPNRYVPSTQSSNLSSSAAIVPSSSSSSSSSSSQFPQYTPFENPYYDSRTNRYNPYGAKD